MKKSGWLAVLTKRPLKAISAVLGITTVAVAVTAPDANGNSMITDITTGIAQLKAGDSESAGSTFSQIPQHVLGSVMSGAWIAPAIATAITGIISRKFKI